MIPRALERLVRELKKLPGIGEKTAYRLAFHVLTSDRIDPAALATAIAEVRERVRPCPECGFHTDQDRCTICADPLRDDSTLCVVEQASDLIALDRSGAYRGRYHVLGGALSPIDGIGPDDLGIDALFRRLERFGTREVILATSTGVAGEATAAYLARGLRERGLTVTRLAYGVPLGTNLEYIDGATLERALSGRREF